jgi:hypothetical protein
VEKMNMKKLLIISGISICAIMLIAPSRSITVNSIDRAVKAITRSATTASTQPKLDTAAYDAKLLQIANLKTVTNVQTIKATATTPSSTITTTSTTPIGWPVKTVYPNGGALLPFDRIIAYYGNLYSTQMGVLGKYPEPQMLQMLTSTTAEWQAADPATPTIPALDYIAVTAQGSPGYDGKIGRAHV